MSAACPLQWDAAVGDSSRFEQLLADLSTRFAGIPSEQVDAEIDGALERLVGFLGTDRSSFIELLPEEGLVAVTHSWARPGVRPAERATPVSGNFPWYHERLRRGEVLRFERIPDELPIEAEAERAYMTALPMLSHIAVPLWVGGSWVCALLTATAKSYRSWKDAEIEQVRIVGQILANAIYRRKLERELRESLDEVRRLRATPAKPRTSISARRSATTPASSRSRAGAARCARCSSRRRRWRRPATAVLLLGETGTGKELLARAIHARSSARAARSSR